MGVNVTSPEPDAVVRKMPVLIRINGKIYPSMILENVRLLNGSKRIKVIAKEHGIDSVLVSKKAGVPVNHNAEMYINYAEPEKYVQMSATEIFSDNFNENKIKGRIVVVGMDAAGLSVLKYTPHGLTTDQMISAQALDTLLTGQHLLRIPQADTYEIIFILDPSKDKTEEKILNQIKKNKNIKLLILSRKFGQPISTIAGIENANGNYCVVIDVDLQDPPELIEEMYNKIKIENCKKVSSINLII